MFDHSCGGALGKFLVWALTQNAAMDTLVTAFGAHESDFFGSLFFSSGLLIAVKYT